MYPNEYDFDVESDHHFFDEDYEVPDAPESWEINDFEDIFGSDDGAWH